jgi:hypothetical protein
MHVFVCRNDGNGNGTIQGHGDDLGLFFYRLQTARGKHIVSTFDNILRDIVSTFDNILRDSKHYSSPFNHYTVEHYYISLLVGTKYTDELYL